MRNRLLTTLLLLGGGGTPPVVGNIAWEDTFDTAEDPAGIPRTNDGVGMTTGTDNAGEIAIADGIQTWTTYGGVYTDPGRRSVQSFARAEGLCFKFENIRLGQRAVAGVIDASYNHYHTVADGATFLSIGGVNIAGVWQVDQTSYWDIAIVLRAAGAALYKRTAGTGAWSLDWVIRTGTTTPVYIGFFTINTNNLRSLSRWAVRPMLNEWATADGLADSARAGAVTAGTTFTHPASFVMVLGVGTISGTTKQVRFAIQDADNYMVLELDSTSTRVIQVVAASPTTLITGTAVATDTTLTLRRDGALIRIANTGSLGSTASASNFQTETDGSVLVGDVADMYIYDIDNPQYADLNEV